MAIYLIAGLISPERSTVGGPQAPDSVTQERVPLTRENLLRLVNEERAKVGVDPLEIDETLNQSAQWKAEDMQNLNYRDHHRPGEAENAGLNHARELLSQIPLDCKTISENLSWNSDNSELSANQAINWWKSSQLHYQAMIDPRYTHTGIGTTHSITVQHFCET